MKCLVFILMSALDDLQRDMLGILFVGRHYSVYFTVLMLPIFFFGGKKRQARFQLPITSFCIQFGFIVKLFEKNSNKENARDGQ